MKKNLTLFGLVSIILLISSLNGLKLNLFYPPFIDSELKPSDSYPIIPFKVGVMYGPVDADPQYMGDSASFDYAYQVWEGLYAYDLASPDLDLIPRLAAGFGTWSGANYTVPLRQGVSFHSGAPFNATAVKFTFDRLLYLTNLTGTQPLSGPGSTIYGESNIKVLYMWPDGTPVLDKVEIIDDYTIKFVLSKAYGVWLPLLAFTASMILDPTVTPALDYICEGMAGATSETISGTGPFLYDGYTPGVEVNFSAYQDYWRGKANIDQMIFKVISNSDARNNAMLAGDINFQNDPHPSYHAQMRADPDVVLYEGGPGTTTQYLGFNNKKFNITWRTAMSYAIDYDYAIDELLLGTASRLKSPIPLGIQYGNWSFDIPYYNLTIARQIMNSMGYGTTFMTDAQWVSQAASAPFKALNYTYLIGNQFQGDFFVLFEENMKHIGIRIVDNGQLWGPYSDLLYNVSGGWDRLECWFIGWMPNYNDPSNYVNSLMSNISSSNSAQVNDPQLEQYMLEGLQETDPAKRQQIYWDLQKYVVEELRPHAYVYCSNVYDAYSSNLKGFPHNGMGYVYFYPCEWSPYEMSISSPSDISYVEGTMGNNIIWYIDAEYTSNPNCTLYINDIFNRTGVWSPSIPLSINIDGFSVGIYEFRLEIHNGDESAQISVNVTVIPLELSITHPNDISFTEGSTGNSISWTISTNAEINTTYYIYKDNILVYNDTWHSGIPVIYYLDELSVGEYSIRIVAYNEVESVEDIVSVTVNPPEEIIPGYPLLVFLGVAVILTILINVYIKKKSKL